MRVLRKVISEYLKCLYVHTIFLASDQIAKKTDDAAIAVKPPLCAAVLKRKIRTASLHYKTDPSHKKTANSFLRRVQRS